MYHCYPFLPRGIVAAIYTLRCWCRATYGDYFGIGVAGYPEAHPDAISDDPAENEANYKRDLVYLKEKVCAHITWKGGMSGSSEGCHAFQLKNIL